MGRVIVDDSTELEVRRMLDELQERALAGSIAWAPTRPVVQALIEGRGMDIIGTLVREADTSQPRLAKRDLAEERRVVMERLFYGRHFADLNVPKPKVSNREFARRAKKGQQLFYRPASSRVPYEVFMRACGQGENWTVIDAADRAKIGWEPTTTGYWFWAEVPKRCPRLQTSWHDLMEALAFLSAFLSLEEYIIVWYAMKAEGINLDWRGHTMTWLRTRFGTGALYAYGGLKVGVYPCSADDLVISCGNHGGRLAETVQ
ncbi:MAG: hypothetical protein Q7T01_00680 [bacterium]|nr:hypothetical protein [bacterium]